jgi:hypothetical protein
MEGREADPGAALSRARFGDVPASAGHYESFFLKACHPDGGLGVWIRYTVHKRPHLVPTGALWFTLFDARAGVRASKVPVANLSAPAGGERYLALGDASIGPGGAVGRADSDELRASWKLEFADGEEPFFHLPASWMYDAAIPRTKVLAQEPQVRVDGTLEVADRTIELARWRGTVGHNWGREHAERAIWIHGAGFPGNEEAWLDLAIGRIRLGPVMTPWIANGVLSLEGRRHRLGGIGRVRSTQIEETPESCRFAVTGDGVAIEGVVGAARERFVGWIYAQPDGAERQTVNCSIADLRATVKRPGAPAVKLSLDGGAAYELQTRERYARIPVQPFPDG